MIDDGEVMHETLFYIFAALSAICAAAVISRKNLQAACLALVLFVMSISVLFSILSSNYVSVAVILIMVVSVALPYCLTGLAIGRRSPSRRYAIRFERILGASAVLYLALVLCVAIAKPPFLPAPMTGEAFSSSPALGRILFSSCALPLEMVAVAIFTSAIAASIIRKRRTHPDDEGIIS